MIWKFENDNRKHHFQIFKLPHYLIDTLTPLYNFPSAETMYCSSADNPDKTST